tara:strand:+ start:172 stop:369 length:198 start_codon:yes stop_codon:yes gene_type:complete
MSLSKNKKPLNENSVNGKPMNDFVYQSIMGEYLISPYECLENLNIQKAISMNDEVMLRKILECEY